MLHHLKCHIHSNILSLLDATFTTLVYSNFQEPRDGKLSSIFQLLSIDIYSYCRFAVISKAVILQVLEKSAISACVGLLEHLFGQQWSPV